jgi:2-amino-4-hydroxy-6-hydroxymethyldihydropteridine diphosphokinase
MASSVFLGLGTNMGDREALLNKVIELITRSVGPVAACSGIYITEPWGFESRDNFLNMVIQVYTDLQPFDLLEKLSIIENQLGRKRSSGKYISRTIDIDILIYGKRVIDSPDLKIPHPLIQDRKFVLIPFCDIAPQLIHPVLDKTFAELIKECKDERKVKKVYPHSFYPLGGKEIQST